MAGTGSAPLIETSEATYTQNYASQLFQQPKVIMAFKKVNFFLKYWPFSD